MAVESFAPTMPPTRHHRPAPALVGLLALSVVVGACSSGETERRADPRADGPGPAPTSEDSAAAAPPSSTLPTTWEEVPSRLEFVCPGPFFELAAPSDVEVAGHRMIRKGSTWVADPAWSGPLTLGVIGAPKDAGEQTTKNIATAAKAFGKAGVQLVLVNGDLSEDDDLEAVMRMLAEAFPALPVAVHAGNIEWAGAFTSAFDKVSREHGQLINLNWVRDLDLGAFHLVSLPGYYDGKFARSGACRYTGENLADTRRYVRSLREQGEQVVLSSHGPPKSRDFEAIDFAHEAGNVGDERISELILEEDVRFGIFGHILEAGGRATSELKRGTPLALPVKEPVERLYVNVGSASSFPWTMLDGTASEGMAFVVVLDDRGGRATQLKLR